MLQLRLSNGQIDRFKRELRRAGIREIGGVLVGEHVGDGLFDLLDFSVQRAGGDVDYFVREPEQHRKFLHRFFEKTGHDYTRFNYLGEWHSHPLFSPVPGTTDLRAMQEIVEDQAHNASFAMLLILRLDVNSGVEASTTAFRPASHPAPVSMSLRQEQCGSKRGCLVITDAIKDFVKDAMRR
jgi:[CysO sulfur-carrier protein]-S-L-cysteine hydrolase